jgi:hypothetical protein
MSPLNQTVLKALLLSGLPLIPALPKNTFLADFCHWLYCTHPGKAAPNTCVEQELSGTVNVAAGRRQR